MTRKIRVGFVMDQVAGHVTAYRNLRRVADLDDEIEPVWGEVHYHVPGGRIEWFRERVVPFAPSHPFGVARGLLEQRRALGRGPFDVIFTNTATAHLARRQLVGTPSMFDFDSTPIQLERMGSYSAAPDSKPVAAVKHRLMRRLFETVTVNQAWSRWARQSVVDDYGIPSDRVLLNPPGVDLAFWKPRTLTPSDGPPHVLFVGADFERKGGYDLLEWHRSVAPGSVELDIVTRDDVPSHPGVNVFHGVGPNSAELQSLHAAASVFVLPSKGECFGIATIEAMASAIPVVASDVGGTADIVDEGKTGYVVPAGSPRRLGEAIEAILRSDDGGAEMGRRARVVAEQRFDLDKNALLTVARLKALARGTTPA